MALSPRKHSSATSPCSFPAPPRKPHARLRASGACARCRPKGSGRREGKEGTLNVGVVHKSLTYPFGYSTWPLFVGCFGILSAFKQCLSLGGGAFCEAHFCDSTRLFPKRGRFSARSRSRPIPERPTATLASFLIGRDKGHCWKQAARQHCFKLSQSHH